MFSVQDARWKVTVTYKRTRDEQQVDVDTDEYIASRFVIPQSSLTTCINHLSVRWT